jgi:hypothetical protein
MESKERAVTDTLEAEILGAGAHAPPGIIIHSPGAMQPRPSIFAFIWGGKVAPVPALPYGRRTA